MPNSESQKQQVIDQLRCLLAEIVRLENPAGKAAKAEEIARYVVYQSSVREMTETAPTLAELYLCEAMDELAVTEARASAAESSLAKSEAKGKSLQATLDMYASAWARELGGKLIPKSHEIDALVLTTRRWQGRIEWAERIILGQQVYERFKEAFDLLAPNRQAASA